ncbi:MAG: AMP-binding protein [Deltaproteobacteria bacterium]|nr:AMP-binding protein [Deltaproteobacteria bacterium]
MALRDRLAELDPRVLAQRLAADPPHRIVARAAAVLRRTGMLEAGANRVAMARVVLREGMGVRSMHAIHAAATPGRTAIIDRHRRLDYAGLLAEIEATAHLLHDDGARRGEPVGLMMENRAEYIVLWMALTRLGIPCAHLSSSSKASELGPLLERTGIVRLFVSEATAPTAAEFVHEHPDTGLAVFHVGEAPPASMRPYRTPMHARLGRGPLGATTGGDAASVVYTSGTTGQPKGAVRDLGALGPLELLRILERLPMRVGDRHLVVAPLYHSGAQAFTLINTALASTLVLLDRFDADQALALLSRERIHSVFMVPTMLQRILDLPASVHARRPTPCLNAIISGAAPFSIGLRARAIERFGAGAIFDFYGATELGWVTLADGHEMSARPGTLGRALGGQELRVVDDARQPVPPGTIGKIYTRSAQHMRGYLRDDEATAEIRDHGWVTVDDLGFVDADGHLFLTGRARDMVISGGVNVYPAEVENVLSQHDSVRDVAVIGLPDPQWGERLTAVIVPAPGFDVAQVAQLDGWCRERLAKAKLPRRWETVDTLPRNPTGKVLKQLLRDQFGGPDGAQGPTNVSS